VPETQDKIRFEQLVLPHLDSATNLARWLLRNRADYEDVVQEAMLRAYRFFSTFSGWGRACVAAANCSQHLLYVAGEKPGIGIND
jgi:DNA-directed RNA polymerase specialized sigma24 family protein